MKKSTKFLFLISSILVLFTGCSYKEQLAQTPDTYNPPIQEAQFKQLQKENKNKQKYIQQGRAEGYQEAKKELAKIIPYLEGLRISSLVKEAGGWCFGPIYQDRRNKNSLKLVIGKVHLCEEFTVDRIFELAKSGLPGLPEEYTNAVASTSNGNTATSQVPQFAPSSISIGGEDGKTYFTSDVAASKKVVAHIAKNYNNMMILKKLNLEKSEVIYNNDQGFYQLEFNSQAEKESFCQKNLICSKD